MHLKNNTMKFKGLNLSDVALSNDELSQIKGGTTVLTPSYKIVNISSTTCSFGGWYSATIKR